MLWSIWYAPSEVAYARSSGAVSAGMVGSIGYGLRFTAASTLGFAALIGAYNGLFCCGENQFGRSLKNPLLAGGAIGTVIGCAFQPGKWIPIAATAAGTAALCVAAQIVMSDHRDRQVK